MRRLRLRLMLRTEIGLRDFKVVCFFQRIIPLGLVRPDVFLYSLVFPSIAERGGKYG